MSPATILYGVGCVGALWLSRKDDLRLTLAFALTYVWMVANLAYHVDALVVLAIVDTLVAFLATRLNRTVTTDEVVILSTIRVALHLAYALGLPFQPFAVAYNLSFAVMLGAVASSGGIINGARDCLRALRDRGDGDSGGTVRLLAPHLAAEA